MEGILGKSEIGLSRRIRISWSQALRGAYGLLELAALIGVARWSDPKTLGIFAIGWALALPWFALSDLPPKFRVSLKSLILTKSVSLGFAWALLAIGTWVTPLSWKSFALMGLVFFWKGLESFIIAYRRASRPPEEELAMAPLPEENLGESGVHPFLVTHRGLATSLGLLISLIPLLVLATTYGFETAGFFAVMGAWFLVGPRFLHISQPHLWGPFKEIARTGDREEFSHHFLKVLGWVLLVSVLLVLAVVLWGKAILTWVFGAQFAKYQDVFLWLTVAGALLGANTVLCGAIAAIRGLKDKVPSMAVWATLQGVLCILMIPSLGIAGGAWALCLTGLLLIMAQFISLERALNQLEK